MNLPADFQEDLNPLLLSWLTNNGTGGIGGGGGMATGSVGMGNLADCLELEDLGKIVEVLEYRKNLHNQPNFTIASGNFLPSSTLQQGARLGLAVCRIARNFSVKDLQKEIADIQKLPCQIRNRYKSSKILQEIFSIPEEFFESIEDDDALQFLFNKSNSEDFQLLSQINPVPWATGFLVGGSHLLTNWHVIPTKEIAKQAVAQFNYVKDDIGEVETTIEYEFDTDALFIANSALDYTLVQLKSGFQKKPPGYQMGWIPLVEKEDAIAPGLIFSSEPKVKDLFKNKLQEMEQAEPKQEAYFDLKYYRVRQQKLNKQDIYVIWQSPDSYSARQKFASKGQFEELEEQFQRIENNIQEVIKKLDEVKFTDDFINSQKLGEAVFIIQHPKGRTQEVVLFENKVCNNGLLKNYLRYTADADYGSSGSPVFNAQWELVALHHAAIPNNFDRKLPADQPFIKAQQGVRICRIVEDLKRKSSGNPRLQSFIEDFVITEEQLKYPPLPAALQLNGITDCIDMKPIQGAKTSPEFSIEAWVKPDLLSSDTTIFSQVCHEKWYQEFGEDSVFGQYLLSLQLTPDRRVVFSREPLWALSSSAFPENGLLYPLIQSVNLEGQTEQKKHPLDILALPSVDQPEITIDHSNKEKVQALQCILYCLGLFPKDDTYDEIVKNGGDLNEKTIEVINKEFDEAMNPESWLPSWISITGNTVTIKSEALGFFKTRGSYLGLGTPREKTKTLEPQLKGNYSALKNRVILVFGFRNLLGFNKRFLMPEQHLETTPSTVIY